MSDARSFVRRIAKEHQDRGDAFGWFDRFYRMADGDDSLIPWGDMTANPNLIEWLDREKVEGADRSALTVGCGLGDDAEELSRRGFDVTAFDLSPTAIEWCARRYPKSSVEYVAADLRFAPESWTRAYDFVLESYTLQALPLEVRAAAIPCVARFVAPGGMALVIARGREDDDPIGEMPWKLSRSELSAFEREGLRVEAFEDYQDGENPPVRRFRVVYRQAASA